MSFSILGKYSAPLSACFFLCFLGFTTSCNSGKSSDNSAKIIEQLKAECDVVDYMFNNVPMSINQTEPLAIQHTLTYISEEVSPKLRPECLPAARMVFYGRGEIIVEADIYFEGRCQSFVFIKDNQVLFTRKMTEDGVSFHQSVLNQMR